MFNIVVDSNETVVKDACGNHGIVNLVAVADTGVDVDAGLVPHITVRFPLFPPIKPKRNNTCNSISLLKLSDKC